MARALFDSCKSYYSLRLGTSQVTSNGNFIIGVRSYDKEDIRRTNTCCNTVSMHINLNSNINIIAQLMMISGTSLACISSDLLLYYSPGIAIGRSNIDLHGDHVPPNAYYY